MRLRLVARCTDDAARVPPQDFLLRATLSAEVLVVTQGVASGQPVSDDQLQLQRRDISQTPDALSTLEAGFAARTTLRPGQLLQKRLLAAAIVVKRGDAVRIQASRGGVSVEGAGEALDSGARQGLDPRAQQRQRPRDPGARAGRRTGRARRTALSRSPRRPASFRNSGRARGGAVEVDF